MGSKDVSLPHTATRRPGAVGVHVCVCSMSVLCVCVHACAAFAMPLGVYILLVWVSGNIHGCVCSVSSACKPS